MFSLGVFAPSPHLGLFGRQDVARQLRRRSLARQVALPLGTRPSNPQQNAQLGEARNPGSGGSPGSEKEQTWDFMVTSW